MVENKKIGGEVWRKKRKQVNEQNIARKKLVKERNTAKRNQSLNRRRLFLNEYKAFAAAVKKSLKSFNPSISLFGSLARHNKNPHDIDVAVDVKGLSDKQFKLAMREIKKLKRKYPHVDPVLYSWDVKRLPPKKYRDKIRWDKDMWDWYEKI